VTIFQVAGTRQYSSFYNEKNKFIISTWVEDAIREKDDFPKVSDDADSVK